MATTKPNTASVIADTTHGAVHTPAGDPYASGAFFRDSTSPTGYSYTKHGQVVKGVHVNAHNPIHPAPGWYHPAQPAKATAAKPAASPIAPGGLPGTPKPPPPPAPSPFAPWVQQATQAAVAPIYSGIADVNAQSAADIAKSQATQQGVQANLGALATSGDNAAAQFAARAAAAQQGSDATAATQQDYLNRLLNGTVDAGAQGAGGVQHAIDVSKGATDQSTAIGALTWGHEAQAAHNFATGLQGLAATSAQQFQQDRTGQAAHDVHDLQLQVAQAMAQAPQMQHESDLADRTYNEGVRQFNAQQALATTTEQHAFGNQTADNTNNAAQIAASKQVGLAKVAAAKAAATAKAQGKSKADQVKAAAAAAAAATKVKAAKTAHNTAVSKQATQILAKYNTPVKDTRPIIQGKRVGPKPKGHAKPKSWYDVYHVLNAGGMSQADAAYMASQQFPNAPAEARGYNDAGEFWQYNPATGKFVRAGHIDGSGNRVAGP